MYAIAVVRYRKPLEEVLVHIDAHRAYLRDLQAKGILIASGALDPRNGGALVLRVPDGDVNAALDRIRDNDPFIKAKVAQYEIWAWNVSIGKDRLDTI